MTTLTPRTAYLVLGMHRSGTSAMTQLLALAGANLPENLMPGDEHNAKGYFEPWRIALVNNERLRAGGHAWDDPFAFPYRALPDEAAWVDQAVIRFDEEYGQASYPLLKDPRVTVLLPMWRAALDRLGIVTRCVIPVRHPLAVAGSLARRDGFSVEKSVAVWTAYMLAAEAYTRDAPRVFVDYDSLLADWRGQTRRIETAHAAPLPRLDARAEEAIGAFLSPELRHNASEGALSDYGWAGAMAQSVHDWFAAAAHDHSPAIAPLEAAGQELTRRAADMAPFVSPLTRDLDEARTELLESRRRTAVERARIAEICDQALEAR